MYGCSVYMYICVHKVVCAMSMYVVYVYMYLFMYVLFVYLNVCSVGVHMTYDYRRQRMFPLRSQLSPTTYENLRIKHSLS